MGGERGVAGLTQTDGRNGEDMEESGGLIETEGKVG